MPYDPTAIPDWTQGPPPALEAALFWAQHLGPVFPCEPKGKRPIVKGGFLSASRDPKVIRGWFNRSWGANVALAVPPEIVVVDLDSAEASDRLREEELELPPTFTVRTAHGEHRYYRVEKPVARQVGWRPGVDLCGGMPGHAGFVMLPPSRHPSGAIYRATATLEEQPIAVAPPWVHGAARGREITRERGAEAGGAGGCSPAEGSRHALLVKMARRLAQDGLDADQIFLDLIDVCEERGWSDKRSAELIRIARWAMAIERGG